ncbi:MAG: hypothetical protein QOI42_1695 [Frankiaceae bacterium]|nr:hypothetical protein [Frankiaceae bacterium]
MKAIVVKSYGASDVLALADAEDPVPGASEVLVRVRAAGINPVDIGVQTGAFPILAPPYIPGWDVAGVVERADPGIPLQVGDEVFGLPSFPREGGAYAEYVVGMSRHFARKPAGLTFVEAAALPLVGLTAWQGLVDMADLAEGQRVLITGASGGVGHIAVQIAKARGAHVVAVGGAGRRGFVLGLGADEFVDRDTDFAADIDPVDVVFECVGRGYADRTLAVLAPGGILVTIVERWDTALAERVTAAGRRFAGVAVEPDLSGLRGLAALVDVGQLRPHVSAVFQLEKAADAHDALAAGVIGKVVLEI